MVSDLLEHFLDHNDNDEHIQLTGKESVWRCFEKTKGDFMMSLPRLDS